MVDRKVLRILGYFDVLWCVGTEHKRWLRGFHALRGEHMGVVVARQARQKAILASMMMSTIQMGLHIVQEFSMDATRKTVRQIVASAHVHRIACGEIQHVALTVYVSVMSSLWLGTHERIGVSVRVGMTSKSDARMIALLFVVITSIAVAFDFVVGVRTLIVVARGGEEALHRQFLVKIDVCADLSMRQKAIDV